MALTVRLTDDGDSIGEMHGAWAYELRQRLPHVLPL
jgi:hypothetical protein